MVMDYERFMFTRIRRMAERDSITEELFPGADGGNDNIGETDNV